MKVLIIKSADPSEPNELFMTPETDSDLQVLEKLLENFEITGFGRNSPDLSIVHMSVELKRLAE